MEQQYDFQQIRKAINVLKMIPLRKGQERNSLFEVRMIGHKWNASGYFKDADQLEQAMKAFRPRAGAQVYITLNELNPSCYSKQQRDRFLENPKTTSSDGDVTGRDWLLLDFDPKRTADTSSSDEELEHARKLAHDAVKYLKARGWSDPVVAMSGNGYHLLYRVDMKTTDENTELIKKFLSAMDLVLPDEKVAVDTAVFNAARITKLYGTVATKGSDTPERPHRMSRIEYVPAEIKVTGKDFITAIVENVLPKEQKPEKYNSYSPADFSVDDFILRHGIRVKSTEPWNGGTKWVLEECPFNPEHKGKDASIVQNRDGKLCFNCFHTSCAGNKWKQLRELYEPDAYDRPAIPNAHIDLKQKPPEWGKKATEKTENTEQPETCEPIWMTTEQIRTRVTPAEEFIPSGIREIDRKMRGLKKGFVSLISGLRASGKSSIISQLALNCRNRGYRVAIYSGELTGKNVLRWLTLQCAGKAHTRNLYEGDEDHDPYYVPDDGIEEKLSKWMDGSIFIYNNDYGNDFTILADRIGACVDENKIDLLILDNMMALNLEGLDQDKYERQSKFVQTLQDMAKEKNIHIVFVAHPRKSQGFLRLDDVSGSNDIVNRVDNAFIVHRVNNDFIRLSKEMFKWTDDHKLYRASNVIEICKDRDNGNQDIFISLFYEPESKRLLNERAEVVNYGWEFYRDRSQDDEQTKIEDPIPPA